MAEPALEGMTLDTFLDWDDGTDCRYELIAGRPVAMARPNEKHATLVASITIALGNRLSEKCRVLTEAGVVLSSRNDSYYQADIAVSCSPLGPDSRWTTDPVVLIEVLSPSTRAHDRSTKLPDYRDVPSVQEIVLVSSDSRRVEHWHRQDGGWHVRDLIGDAELRLDSIGVSVPFETIYHAIGL